jgi:CO/xanthine dehydrogenase Mo-binding subunit
MASKKISRRQFARNASSLLIGFSLADTAVVPEIFAVPQREGATSFPTGRLNSWLRIERDGIIRVFTGKMDCGQGVETALAQIVAEELDVSPGRVALVMGDTSTTADQGGVGSSSTISQGSRPLRNAAATARALLLQLGSRRLEVRPDQLEVRDGIIRVKNDSSKSISYADLIGDDGLNETLNVSGAGFGLNVEGTGKPKDPASYTVVGTSVPRKDIPPKILGQFQYVTDVRVPGMLHGRVVRPAGVGAKLIGIDEDSVKGIPGYVKTVVKGDFVGVVAESEWAAIKAAKALKAMWTAPLQAFPEQKDLYPHMRSAVPRLTRETVKRGDAATGLANAVKKVEARYEFPFQSHATMGPGCAIADVHMDGVTTVWSGGQKSHHLQRGYSELLGVPLDKVRVVWVQDAGSYGRPGFEDTGADALLLSQAIGRPVRVQWMRADMTSWGPKGPAAVYDLVAGLDAKGDVSGLQFTSRAYSGGEIHFLPATAGNYLASQLSGIPNKSGVNEFADWGVRAPDYTFENLHAVAHVLAAFHDTASPLNTTHLRDPEGPATSFAVESFMDELAAAAGADPIEFRLKYLSDARAKAVLIAAAERARWESRPSPKKNAGAGDIVTGRGIALATRNGTYVGTIAEVEVHRRTGAVRVTRFVCAHDCGLVVNPDGLRAAISANLVQSLSRSLKEEVMFSRSNVTSADWRTYPVARFSDIPAQVDIVLLNHPEIPPGGAGEAATRPTAAAIGNAIFDATGARVRQGPLTPARVKAAL